MFLTIQDEFSDVLILIHENKAHVGSFSSNLYELKSHNLEVNMSNKHHKNNFYRHALNKYLHTSRKHFLYHTQRAFLDLGLGIRVPSIAMGHSGSIEGNSNHRYTMDLHKKTHPPSISPSGAL